MTTRFSPTPSGRLHLGHLYLALINYHTAAREGGRFIVRFDDLDFPELQSLGRDKVNEFCETIKEEFSWMGMKVDLYSHTAKEHETNLQYLSGVPGLEKDDGIKWSRPFVRNEDRPYPFIPLITAIKVVQDHREGCNIIIRGEDLVSESSLYYYFCRLLGFVPPKLCYIPKLIQRDGQDLSDMSKTRGNFKIKDYRERGYAPQDVLNLLAEACLEKSDGGWYVENTKKNPVLDKPYWEQ
ncbi:MAG: glutamate--tRNA ligase family protein [Proteobacteria bacterium]|jgi:glutamyl/glutaminyl-tRNA synthetase|nr:glutamate--tRNA ligase family protein [Pseudomonadota bacterium]